jgi:hypothetical protein
MEITPGTHNERIGAQRRGKLKSHRIDTHGVIGTVAMNFIRLPIVADRLPNALMDGINFSR